MDTSAGACSAALWEDAIIFERTKEMQRGHAEALLPMIFSVMRDADRRFTDLDLVAVTVGPGAFTGLRVGLAAARGIALAAGLSCFGVTTLEAIAEAIDWPTLARRPALVALDNKQGGVYAQMFQAGRPLEPPSVQTARTLGGTLRRSARRDSRRRLADADRRLAGRGCRRTDRGDRCAAIPDGEPGSGNRRPSLVGGRKAVDAAGAALPAAAHDRAAAGESRRRMIEPVVIGPAVAADAEAIAAMDRECLQDGWEATTVGTLLGELSAICRVARSHSGIAGFVLCRLAADECEVLSCAVDTGFRRRGTARLLLQAAFDEAVSRGGRKAFLEVAEDNAPALALYTGLGFRTAGRRRRYYRRPRGEAIDALVMSRAL